MLRNDGKEVLVVSFADLIWRIMDSSGDGRLALRRIGTQISELTTPFAMCFEGSRGLSHGRRVRDRAHCEPIVF